MTTPAPPQAPQQQPQAPPPPPQADGLDDAALAVAVAAILAGVLAPGITAAAALVGLKARFFLTAASLVALGAVLNMVMQQPPPVTGVIGTASEQVARMNAARRAQYVIAAAKRVKAAEAQARAKGESVEAARAAALETEKRYYQAHQKAMWDRSAAAGRIDMEAATHGPLLGWLAIRDARVTAECKSASGKNFYVDNPPYIGLPGIGPHSGCRCQAVPPWPGGKLLPGSGPRYARAA